MKKMIQKPRGTMDILPEQMPLWRYIEETARRVAAKNGFEEIRIPTFEATELFQRGVGEGTDVVQKEMYTFKDREDRSFTLRPEGTAGVVRAILENGRASSVMPMKLFYLVNCFRYEKPQAGRSREFFQFGAEMFGAPSAYADAAVISLADSLIKELGIKGSVLHLNSIGCPECRPKFRDALKAYFEGYKDEICDTCKSRLETNPLRLLDCKSPVCSSIAKNAPKTLDYLCDDCKCHFDSLTASLDAMGVKYTVDTNIVRGLDYYTRTVYEFVYEGIGAQSAIGGGGRYDGLVKELGGPALPACGFAMGITRLILALEASGVCIPENEKPLIYIAPLGDKARCTALKITRELRDSGIYAECDLMERSLKAQMKYADKIGAKYTLLIGESELEAGNAILRNMTDASQSEVPLDSVKEALI
ncbi:MAG: histidine--tRNA ligase [Clostridia bacterium]|nr:histidine--tRNA ligase [Clostridia bacterium]